MTIVININTDGSCYVDSYNNDNWTMEIEQHCATTILKRLLAMYGNGLGIRRSNYKNSTDYEFAVLGRANNEIYLLLHVGNLHKYLLQNHVIPNEDIRKRLDFVIGSDYLDKFKFSSKSISNIVNNLNVLPRTRKWVESKNKDYSKGVYDPRNNKNKKKEDGRNGNDNTNGNGKGHDNKSRNSKNNHKGNNGPNKNDYNPYTDPTNPFN